jgi:hypothetical protein
MSQTSIDHNRVAPSDHSLSSRRAVLLGAAASVPIVALAAAPALAHVINEPDPVFAAIERYRIAAKAEDDAEADYSRREKILLENVGQRHPSIGVFDLSNPHGPMYGHQITAYSHKQIDGLCPPDRFPDMNKLHHGWFEDLAKRHADIMGDAERVRQDAAEPSEAALADLVETVPTTMAGVFALIEWQREMFDESDSRQALHTGHYAMMCDAIGDGLRGLTVQT